MLTDTMLTLYRDRVEKRLEVTTGKGPPAPPDPVSRPALSGKSIVPKNCPQCGERYCHKTECKRRIDIERARERTDLDNEDGYCLAAFTLAWKTRHETRDSTVRFVEALQESLEKIEGVEASTMSYWANAGKDTP